MRNATLSEFIALNDQLLALTAAGIPISVSLSPGGGSVASALERINAAIARSMGQGASLSAALDEHRGLITPGYRSLVEVGLQSGDLSTALGGAHAVAESVEDATQTLRSALLYPLILCTLAYVGLIGFCLLLAPRLQQLLGELRIPAGFSTDVLEVLRASLPYWVAIPPILLLLLMWGLRSGASSAFSSRWLSWLPGTSQALFDERCAHFASTLARALEAELPLPEALRASAGAWNDVALEAQLQTSAASINPEGLPTLPKHLPAFLRWVIGSAGDNTSRVQNLQMAAGVYRAAAARRLERLRVLAPILACVFVGGTVTLLYGLLLFLPVIHLLRELAVSS